MEINKVVCMDNLDYMRTLESENIDLIYCDILYGTGRKFKDYQDLTPDKGVIYEFYQPRLKEMYRLLKSTGTIYLQMDYRINHWMRCIMDDIFGYKQFKNEIIWGYSSPTPLKTAFARQHDNILVYTKSGKYTFNCEDIRIPFVRDFDKSSHTKHLSKYGSDLTTEKLEEINKKGMIPRDWWTDICDVPRLHKERVGYDTQKPLKLMERIIKASSNENDICADFFMGSGSFLVKAKELNRKYIGCDINLKALEITNLRLTS